MFALDIGQHQRAGDPVQDVWRRCPAPSLLEPCVPGGADVGALGDLLPAQPRRPSASHCETQSGRIKPGTAIPEIASEQIVGFDGHVDPVGHYTTITSLL